MSVAVAPWLVLMAFMQWCARRHQVNTPGIMFLMTSSGVPLVQPASQLSKNHWGETTDGLTLIPWWGGKPPVWDATVVTPLASSYVDRAVTGASVVSDLAADRKLDKYSSLSSAYTIQPITVNNLGGFSMSMT